MKTRTRLARLIVVLLSLFLVSGIYPAHAGQSREQVQAKDIITTTGVKGGLVVHIGCGAGKLTAALRVNESYLVHGLDKNAKNIEQAREYIRLLGLYGKVSV